MAGELTDEIIRDAFSKPQNINGDKYDVMLTSFDWSKRPKNTDRYGRKIVKDNK